MVTAASTSGVERPGAGITSGRAEQTMRRLHAEHADQVFRFLLKLTLGERHLAEDLLQETMVRAWRHIDVLDTDAESQRRWLFIVARRIAIDAARARLTRPAEVGSLDLNRMAAAGDTAEGVVAGHTVHSALPLISAEHREVLTALYFQGMSPPEIAAVLGIPEGTVKSRTHYALRALRAAIGTVS